MKDSVAIVTLKAKGMMVCLSAIYARVVGIPIELVGTRMRAHSVIDAS